VHEGGFAAAGFTNDSNGFAGANCEINVTEGFEGSVLFAVGFVEISGLEKNFFCIFCHIAAVYHF